MGDDVVLLGRRIADGEEIISLRLDEEEAVAGAP